MRLRFREPQVHCLWGVFWYCSQCLMRETGTHLTDEASWPQGKFLSVRTQLLQSRYWSIWKVQLSWGIFFSNIFMAGRSGAGVLTGTGKIHGGTQGPCTFTSGAGAGSVTRFTVFSWQGQPCHGLGLQCVWGSVDWCMFWSLIVEDSHSPEITYNVTFSWGGRPRFMFLSVTHVTHRVNYDLFRLSAKLPYRDLLWRHSA